MSLFVYLHFPGNCRDAFDFYQSVFGGEFDVFTTFAEGPDDMPIAEDERNIRRRKKGRFECTPWCLHA